VVVQVTSVEETEKDVLVRFDVTDTGIGLPPDSQERLFQPFVQADGSTSRKYGGIGLGLAISKQLTEMMGGKLGYSVNQATEACSGSRSDWPSSQ